MNHLLKDLPLGKPTASWVEPFEFDSTSFAALKKWLTDDQIEALRDRVEAATNLLADAEAAPTFAEEKRVLIRAGELASALADILQGAPARASAELDLIFHKQLGGWHKKELMAAQLEVLSAALNIRALELPAQGRRKSPVFLVSQIAEVLQSAGIATSVAENSKFFKICRIVFRSVGIPQSPAAPIRAYQKRG